MQIEHAIEQDPVMVLLAAATGSVPGTTSGRLTKFGESHRIRARQKS